MSDNDNIVDEEQVRAELYVAPSPWRRLLAMVVLGMCFTVAQSLMFLIAVIQFIWTFRGTEPNENLVEFSQALGKWFVQTTDFLTFGTEDRPFPWSKWPSED